MQHKFNCNHHYHDQCGTVLVSSLVDLESRIIEEYTVLEAMHPWMRGKEKIKPESERRFEKTKSRCNSYNNDSITIESYLCHYSYDDPITDQYFTQLDTTIDMYT